MRGFYTILNKIKYNPSQNRNVIRNPILDQVRDDIEPINRRTVYGN
jgi:hypothetical protein